MTPVELLFSIADLKKVNNSELSRRTGVTRSYVSKIKNNGVQLSMDNYLKYVEALNCELVLKDKDSGITYKL